MRKQPELTPAELELAAVKQRYADAEFLGEARRQIAALKLILRLEALRADAPAPVAFVSSDEFDSTAARDLTPETAAKLAQQYQDEERKKGNTISISEAVNRFMPRASEPPKKPWEMAPQRISRR